MKDWKPRIRGDIDYAKLELSGEEGFLLSRIDGSTSTRELTQLTNIPEQQVHSLLSRLVDQGAIDAAPSGYESPSAQAAPKSAVKPAPAEIRVPAPIEIEEPAAADDAAPPPPTADLAPPPLGFPAEGGTVPDGPDLPPPPNFADEGGTLPELDLPEDDDFEFDDDTEVGSPPPESEFESSGTEVGSPPPESEFDSSGTEVGSPPPESEFDSSGTEVGSPPPESEFDSSGTEVETQVGSEGEAGSDDEDFTDPELDFNAVVESDDERNYRKFFETQLHPMSKDERADMALRVTGPTLLALCYDPEPTVIKNILENAETGLPHARLIAAHHRNAAGLDALAKNVSFLRDAQVQRFLLRNVNVAEGVLKKMMGNKALLPLFKINVGRELSEKARRSAQQQLKRRFQQAQAEEKVALIFKTEGRCMTLLLGMALDGKTAALMASRTYNSTVLVQNLLRWPATPPPVLIRIWKQPTVQRAKHLKQLVLRHPNCPTQIKSGKA